MDRNRLEKKYHGNMSANYEASRVGTSQWEAENRIVTEFLGRFPQGTSVIDVPVGTGRFLELYARRQFKVTGLDVSQPMLAQARDKATGLAADITLQQGSIFSMPYPAKQFDVAVCIRFMDWLNEEDFHAALTELVRVTRQAIVAYIPTYTPVSAMGLPSPGGVDRALRQLKLRFYRYRKRSKSMIYESPDVMRCLAEHELRIVARERIDDSDNNWRRGYERDIYLLEIGSR